MAVEEPIGFTEDGRLITGYRWTDAERAELFMANELYAASPDGQDAYSRLMDGLPSASITLEGYFDPPPS